MTTKPPFPTHPLFQGPEISRRRFLTGTAALGAAVTLGSGLLVPAAYADSPRRGGRLRVGWYSSSARDTLAPARLTSTFDWTLALLVMSTLVRLDKNMALQPDLAERWEPADGGRVWNFTLRHGVTFHNGKSLVADDVVYSMNLHRGEASESAIKSWFSQVENIEAVDERTVRFTLNAPNADMPRLLAWPNTVIVPSGHEDFNAAVGTGPFRIVRFEPGVTFLGARHENYHFEGRPYVDEVEMFGISDSQARMNALLAGDVHFIVRVDPKTVHLLERAPGVAIAAADGQRHITFPMMADRPPTDNFHLRQALRYLVNRQEMLESVLKGYGSLGNDTPVGPSDPYYCKDLPQREFDLDRARYHLREAGLDGGLSIDLRTSEAAGGPIAPDLALLFRETAAQAGISVNVIREPSDGYWSAVWMKHPFIMSNWMPRPTLDLILTQLYHSDASWNEGQFKNERFDQLLVEARAELDEARRHELYCEVQRLLYEEGNSIIPLFTNWLDARSDRLMGWEGNPFGEGDGYRLAEHVWLAA